MGLLAAYMIKEKRNKEELLDVGAKDQTNARINHYHPETDYCLKLSLFI